MILSQFLLDDEDESRRSHRRHIMVDVLGNNPWDSKFISTVPVPAPVSVPAPAPVSIPTLTDAYTGSIAIRAQDKWDGTKSYSLTKIIGCSFIGSIGDDGGAIKLS